MTPGGLGLRLRPVGRRVPQRRRASAGTDTRGQRVVDDSFLLLFNAHDEPIDFTLPPEEYAPAWQLVVDTAGLPDDRRRSRPARVTVAGKAMVVLQRSPRPTAAARRHRRGAVDPAVADAVAAAEPGRRSRTVPADAGRAGTGVDRRDRAAQPAPTDGDRGIDVRSPGRPTGCRSPPTRPAAAAGRSTTCADLGRRTGSTCRRCWRPTPGSDHGYDVVDHAERRPGPRRRGRARRAVADAAHAAGLGVLVDIVPNHVGVATPAQPAGGGTCCRTAGSPRTPARSTSTGRRRRPGPAAGARRRPGRARRAAGRGRRAALLRPPLPDRARAPATARRGRCTTASTTSW